MELLGGIAYLESMPRVRKPIYAFDKLPAKQMETALLIAEGLTGKEIAERLEISHSAVAQRIETLRRKFGGVTKHELARLARDELSGPGYVSAFNLGFAKSPLEPVDEACIKPTGQKYHLPNPPERDNEAIRHRPEAELLFSDAFAIDATPPWTARRDERLVPEVLDGENATVARWAYVIGAAVGLSVLLLVLLAVAEALGNLA